VFTGNNQSPAIYYYNPETMTMVPILHAALPLPPGEHQFYFCHQNNQKKDHQWTFEMMVQVVAVQVQ
jgi:hypothetical protein